MARKPARKKTAPKPKTAAKPQEDVCKQFAEDGRLMGPTTKEDRERHAAETGRPTPKLMDGVSVQKAPTDPLDGEQRRLVVQNTHLSPEVASMLPPTNCRAIMAHCDALAVGLIDEAQRMCTLRGTFLVADARGEACVGDAVLPAVERLDDLICQLGQLRDSLATHAYG